MAKPSAVAASKVDEKLKLGSRVALHCGASRSSRVAADHWVPALYRGPTAKYRSAGLTQINSRSCEQLPLRRESYCSLDVADEIADRHYPVEIVIRDLHSGELIFDR